MGPPMWERTTWPEDGGLAEQDAPLVESLAFVADVMNSLEIELWNEAVEK